MSSLFFCFGIGLDIVGHHTLGLALVILAYFTAKYWETRFQ